LKILSKGRRESVPAAAATGWEREVGRKRSEGERGRGRAGGVILTLFCFATVRGDARSPASPPWVATHKSLRHSPWRCTSFCFATVTGEAKRGYLFEIVSQMVYYLK
jgi:hypothetical protein